MAKKTPEQHFKDLFARFMCGSTEAEKAAADKKVGAWLKRYGKTRIDIPEILARAVADDAADQPPPRQPPPSGYPEVNVLELVLALIDTHLTLTREQRMAKALWVLHSYVFSYYAVSPRLALLSPVEGCGKTIAMGLLKALTADPYSSDNITAAVLYHTLGAREHTMLIDEADNLGLLDNPTLRAVFNSGHRRGGTIDRFIGGKSRKFAVFAPLAIAAIGVLPRPLMHRAIVIGMRRHAGTDAPLERFDEYDPKFALARTELAKWKATCVLALNPEMPPELRNRAADNWRPLLAIADALGKGAEARAAAIALSGNQGDEAPGVVLLADIRTVFDPVDVDRLTSAVLVAALLGIEDSLWSDWRGLRDNRSGHKLSQRELADLLRPFGIRPRTIRLPDGKTSRGYLRSQFEVAWASYCSTADTPTQSSQIMRLLRSLADTEPTQS